MKSISQRQKKFLIGIEDILLEDEDEDFDKYFINNLASIIKKQQL